MTKKLELTSQVSKDIQKMLMNGKPLTQICRMEGSPSLSKVYDWISEDKEFANQIMVSRRIGSQTYLDRMIEELEQADNKNIMVIREKLHHYRWLASKLLGQIYGDEKRVAVDQKIEITWSNDGEDKSYENDNRIIDVTNSGSTHEANQE
jgi:hypothetical protein